MQIHLLRHPGPYENESLASFMSRMAVENSCMTRWLLNEFKLQRLSQFNSITYSREIESISNSVNLTSIKIEKMIMMRYSASKVLIHNPSFLYYEKSKYCPLCMREKSYQRLYWQLKPILICLLHNTYIISK